MTDTASPNEEHPTTPHERAVRASIERHPSIRPGEILVTLPDGGIELRGPNGSRHLFTTEEWAEYSTGCSGNRSPLEMLDWLLGEMARRDVIPAGDVIDVLLDLRSTVARLDSTLTSVVKRLSQQHAATATAQTVLDNPYRLDDDVPDINEEVDASLCCPSEARDHVEEDPMADVWADEGRDPF